MRLHTRQLLNPTGGTNLKGKNVKRTIFILFIAVDPSPHIIYSVQDQLSNRELISVIYRDTSEEKWTSLPFKPTPSNGMKTRVNFPK
jgi:hypothetical protein